MIFSVPSQVAWSRDQSLLPGIPCVLYLQRLINVDIHPAIDRWSGGVSTKNEDGHRQSGEKS